MRKNFSDLPNLEPQIKRQIQLGNIALYFQPNGLNNDLRIKYVLRIMEAINYHLDETGTILGVSPSDNYDKTNLVLLTED